MSSVVDAMYTCTQREEEDEIRQGENGLETQIVELRSSLAVLEQSKEEALCVAAEQTATVRQNLQSQVDSYKEQSQQYALTIVAMEERLLALVEKQQLLRNENGTLKEQLNSQQSKMQPDEEGEVEKLESLIKILRHQLALSCKESQGHQNTIQDLRRCIEEKEKSEDEVRAQHTSELEDTRKTLSSLENQVESQRQEVCQLREKVREKCSELSSLSEQHARREEEMTTVWTQRLETAEKEAIENGNKLMAVGERCLGEHHCKVLIRQRDIISQLRQKIKEQEDGSLPRDASHEATLTELARVREELVEERARRHFEAGGGFDTGSVSESDPVIDALKHSEVSYFNLVASVCEGEFMKRPPDKKMPVSTRELERDSTTEERRKFAEKVAKKIKAVVNMRASDTKQSKGGSRRESCSEDGSSEDLQDTVTRLQSQLEATTEELDQQNRVNLALVRRKEFREQQAAKAMPFRKRTKSAAV